MRYYIASRWANMKTVQLLTENLQALGHEVFSYVEDKRNFVPATDAEDERDGIFALEQGWEKRAGLKELFDKDMAGLTECDIFILLLPAGRSSHIEAGVAYGFRKRLVLIGEPEAVETHYLIFDEIFKTVQDYLDSLKNA